jgi:hypothetical protein
MKNCINAVDLCWSEIHLSMESFQARFIHRRSYNHKKRVSPKKDLAKGA